MKLSQKEWRARIIIRITMFSVVSWSIFTHFDGLAAWGIFLAFWMLSDSRRRVIEKSE